MELPPDVPSFVDKTYQEFLDWCWKVRIGEIKVSRETRDYAKFHTFHLAYGSGTDWKERYHK